LTRVDSLQATSERETTMMEKLELTALDLYIFQKPSCSTRQMLLSSLLMLLSRFAYVPREVEGRTEEVRIALQRWLELRSCEHRETGRAAVRMISPSTSGVKNGMRNKNTCLIILRQWHDLEKNSVCTFSVHIAILCTYHGALWYFSLLPIELLLWLVQHHLRHASP
jgi:hypothetical protein